VPQCNRIEALVPGEASNLVIISMFLLDIFSVSN
jgi:hypothetical protein